MDMFENIVLCKDCSKRMKNITVIRNGFSIRVLQCPACSKRIYHPSDIGEYNRFNNLRSRFFKVKLRMVGNSHAISIPKEIIDFFNATEEMVTLALEGADKLSLMFNEKFEEKSKGNENIKKITKIKLK